MKINIKLLLIFSGMLLLILFPVARAADKSSSSAVLTKAADITLPTLTLASPIYNRKGKRMLSPAIQVMNQGDAVAGSFNIDFYLSTNAVYDATDIPASACNISIIGLAAGTLTPSKQGETATTSCAFPKAATSGASYYLIGVADSTSAVIESNENNNSRSTTVMIKVP